MATWRTWLYRFSVELSRMCLREAYGVEGSGAANRCCKLFVGLAYQTWVE